MFNDDFIVEMSLIGVVVTKISQVKDNSIVGKGRKMAGLESDVFWVCDTSYAICCT